MRVAADHEWRQWWSDLQTRRIAAMASMPAAVLAAWLIGGWQGWLIAMALPLLAFGRLYAWRRPGCHERFAIAGLSPMPSTCVNCGVAAFGLPQDVAAAPEERPIRRRRPLSSRLRRVIAVSQILGGVLVGLITLTSLYQNVPLVWWYEVMLEGIALAAVLSGVLLWRHHPDGTRLASILLLLQVLKLYTPWVVYDLRAGFGVLLHASASTVGIALDARGLLQLGWKQGGEPSVAVNVLAVAWLCILLAERTHRPASPDR